jgi:adenylate cyclase
VSDAGAIAFTDIVGFTRFTAIEGDTRAVELLDTKRRLVDARLPPGARVVKELGDGLMLWIDRADESVRFCLGLQWAARQISADGPFPLWLRVGVHWGQAVERGGDLIGNDVNIAARIVEQASPGEVLASEQLIDACSSSAEVDARPIGPVVMKGLLDAVWLYRLASRHAATVESSRPPGGQP